MNERRFPAGYIPLTMHELGGVPRAHEVSNEDFQRHDNENNGQGGRYGQRNDRRRGSRLNSRRDRGPRRDRDNRSDNGRHQSSSRSASRGEDEQRSRSGRLRFSKKDSACSENDEF